MKLVPCLAASVLGGIVDFCTYYARFKWFMRYTELYACYYRHQLALTRQGGNSNKMSARETLVFEDSRAGYD